MERFLIEVPHPPEKKACLEAIKLLLETGSHYLTHADFGCMDGEHKAWIVVEMENKEEARSILPPLYRAEAKIVKLVKFSMPQIDELLQHHKS